MKFKKTYISFVLLVGVLFSGNTFAQNVINEYSNFECSHSKLVNIPFSKSKNGEEYKEPKVYNQTVFYEHRDQFSFWYKIAATNNEIINCKVTPINEKDKYVVYVYKYNKEDFCNKVFYDKINPLKNNKFLNNTDGKETFELTEFQLKAKKGEAYYFCVLNVSPSNCGHNMTLIEGVDSFKIKAVHLPCMYDEEQKLVENTSAPITKEGSTLDVNAEKSYQVITINVVEENNKSKKLDARLRIIDELTGSEVIIKTNKESNYTMQIEKGRYYKIEALATGYKKFDHSIIMSEYVHPDSSGFDLFLRPVKIGENFVMDNIYFYPNTYALKKESYKEIDYLADFLKNNPEIKIELEGHTNGNNRISKSRAYKDKSPEWSFEGSSKKLSVYRAEAIKKMLIKKGIFPDRIKTVGYGGDRMIVSDAASGDALIKNIRVEVKIL